VNSTSTVLIWDGDDQPPVGDWIVLCLGAKTGAASVSFAIADIINENRDRYRNQLMEWIYEVGVSTASGKTLREHLKIRDNLSAWWVSLPTLHSLGREAFSNEVMRVIAIDDFLSNREPQRIEVATSDGRLIATLEQWCSTRGVEFKKISRPKSIIQKSTTSRIYRSLPYLARAFLMMFLYLRKRWGFRNQELPTNRQNSGAYQLTVFDDFLIFDPSESSPNKFGSKYWTNLIDVLEETRTKTLFVHNYIEEPNAPRPREAIRVTHEFNLRSENQRHIFLDSKLTVRIVFRVIYQYLRLVVATNSLRRYQSAFVLKDSKIDLWPYSKGPMHEALIGGASVFGLFQLNLFEAVNATENRDGDGIFLYEGRSTEVGLCATWDQSRAGRLIGSPHTTINFWDMRYHLDPRSYCDASPLPMPQPSALAITGPLMDSRIVSRTVADGNIVDVEAFRYLYLGQLGEPSTKDLGDPNVVVKMLVFCSYDESDNINMFTLIAQAVSKDKSRLAVSIKPHPAKLIDEAQLAALGATIAVGSLGELLSRCDVVVTPSSTSAAIEAVYLGIPVVTVNNPWCLNLSPLLGTDGAVFVNNSGELSSALGNLAKIINSPANDLFFLDDNIPKWRELLGLPGALTSP